MTSKVPRQRIIFVELIIIFILAIAVFLVAGHYDIIERIFEFAQQHEDYELDEILTVSLFLVFALIFFIIRRWREQRELNYRLEKTNADLENALSQIKTLRSILPICASCKKIRDEHGYWHQVESYIQRRTGSKFSHGICPECMRNLYPDHVRVIDDRKA